jgi:hypothetical protein
MSDTINCTTSTGTLTIRSLGKRAADETSSTTSTTKCEDANSPGTCASVTADLQSKPHQRVNVTGGELTNATWDALIVNANPS